MEDGVALLTNEQVREIRVMFEFFADKNKTFMTIETMRPFVTTFCPGISDASLAILIGKWTDRGAMTFKDFLRMYSAMFHYGSARDLREVFRLLADDAGCIPVQRLRATIEVLMPQLTPHDVTNMIIGVFPEKQSSYREFLLHGNVSFDKFVEMMTGMH